MLDKDLLRHHAMMLKRLIDLILHLVDGDGGPNVGGLGEGEGVLVDGLEHFAVVVWGGPLEAAGGAGSGMFLLVGVRRLPDMGGGCAG